MLLCIFIRNIICFANNLLHIPLYKLHTLHHHMKLMYSTNTTVTNMYSSIEREQNNLQIHIFRLSTESYASIVVIN